MAPRPPCLAPDDQDHAASIETRCVHYRLRGGKDRGCTMPTCPYRNRWTHFRHTPAALSRHSRSTLMLSSQAAWIHRHQPAGQQRGRHKDSPPIPSSLEAAGASQIARRPHPPPQISLARERLDQVKPGNVLKWTRHTSFPVPGMTTKPQRGAVRNRWHTSSWSKMNASWHA